MTLTAHVKMHERGVDAAVVAEPGRTLALIGPNGSGKSTVLAAIAGTIRPGAGAVRTASRVLHDLEGPRPVWLPPRERRVALVTQGADLFPTMTVLDNVAFGPRCRGAGRADAREQAARWLARMELTGLAGRRPVELSGGEHRRVAIARALASDPELLLLDEPFAGVDVEAASLLRSLVAAVAPGLTVILTTHDALDAHLLAQDVAVLADGAIAESGSTAAVLTRPRTEFAARMAGLVLLRGTVGTDATLVTAAGVAMAARTTGLSEGDHAIAAIRPREVRLAPPSGVPAGIADVVRTIEPRGDAVRVHGTTLVADLDPADAAGVMPGDEVVFDLPPLVAYRA